MDRITDNLTTVMPNSRFRGMEWGYCTLPALKICLPDGMLFACHILGITLFMDLVFSLMACVFVFISGYSLNRSTKKTIEHPEENKSLSSECHFMNEQASRIQRHVVAEEGQDIFYKCAINSILIPKAINTTPHALLRRKDTFLSVLRNLVTEDEKIATRRHQNVPVTMKVNPRNKNVKTP